MSSSKCLIRCVSQTRARRGLARGVLSSTLAALTLPIALAASLAGERAAHAQAAPSCTQYPIAWRPAPSARSDAQGELSRVSPDANLSWNANTGTLSSALPLSIPLEGCTEGADVGAQVSRALTSHPALFQLDLREWRTPEPFDCKYLGDLEILSMGRERLAGRPVATDVFAYTLKRIDGVVHLTGVNGTYLPTAGAPLAQSMAACNALTQGSATTVARNTGLQATVFSQCRRTGKVTYQPKANDTFVFAPEESWTWGEDAGQVLLYGERVLRVIVNPANYTPELMQSAARCPDPNGEGDESIIGFDITFDVHTGEIVYVKPGLDCVVC